MYILRYQNQDETYESDSELIKKVEELSQSDLFDHQLVVVERVNDGYMEIGLGMKEKSLLIYTPENDDEDCILSCNPTIQKASVDELILKDLANEDLVLASSDTINLDKALETLAAYLKGEEFKTIIDWYVY